MRERGAPVAHLPKFRLGRNMSEPEARGAIRINALDSRFDAERIRTVTLLSLPDFDVPAARLQAMLSQRRDIPAIWAICDGRHETASRC